MHTHTTAETPARADSNRRGLFSTRLVAGGVVLALAGAQGIEAHAAVSPALEKPRSTITITRPNFAEIAEDVTPAVVNVAVRQTPRDSTPESRFQRPQFPEGSPFDEYFRRFFEERAMPENPRGTPHHARGVGSGFIIDPSGYIVTNHHVVDEASSVEVILNDGTRYPASVKGRDAKTDLALLKIDAGKPLPYVEFGDSDNARVGDWILAVGNPFGLGGSVTAGIISARGRDISSGPFDDYLQIDAPINRGNSGGPLFDAKGRVIGVNTAIFSPSGGNVGIGFAIPSTMAQGIVADLRENGRVERGWLGVQIQPVTEEIAEGLELDRTQGALVASVMPDSPAARAGLRPGDVILKVADTSVDAFKVLPRAVADQEAGSRVTLVVQRQGKTKQLSVTIGAMPAPDSVAAATDTQDATGETGVRLGLYLSPLTPDVRKDMGLEPDTTGAVVARVEDGSPADRAGIRAGSVISMVGQHAIEGPAELVDQVHKAAQQNRPSVLLRVERNGERRFVAVRLAA